MHPSVHLILAFVSASVALPRKEGYEYGWFPYRSAYEDLDPRNIEGLGLGGGNLLRSLEVALTMHPEAFSRQQRNLDSLSGITFGGAKRYDPSAFKRNFDEIDRTGFDSFIKKRNMDEIDRSGFDSFIKKRNMDEIDRSGFDSFIKKRNMDEIDRSGFDSFIKKRNMDEIDRSGFDSFIKKRNMDEIDRSGFDSFIKKRNMDEIDRSGFDSFVKRDAHQSSPAQEQHSQQHTGKN